MLSCEIKYALLFVFAWYLQLYEMNCYNVTAHDYAPHSHRIQMEISLSDRADQIHISLYQNRLNKTLYVLDEHGTISDNYINATILINDTIASFGSCYTYQLFQFADQDIPRSSFIIYFDSKRISMFDDYQSVSTNKIGASIYFCSTMFRFNTPNTNIMNTYYNQTYDNLNQLKITFESYPSNLIFKITKKNNENFVYYKNQFGDISYNYNYNYNYNMSTSTRNLILENIKHGCYDIYIIDENYNNDIEIDSTLNHVNYIIKFNNKTISYGGYFSEYELTSFCTSDSYIDSICIEPNNCINTFIPNPNSTTINGWSFKSYYKTHIDDAPDSILNFYGSNSFEHGLIDRTYNRYFRNYPSNVNCAGSFSCLNSKWDYIQFDALGGRFYCNGFQSCSKIYLRFVTITSYEWYAYAHIQIFF